MHESWKNIETATGMIEVYIEVATDKPTIKRGTLNKTFKFTNSFNKASEYSVP